MCNLKRILVFILSMFAMSSFAQNFKKTQKLIDKQEYDKAIHYLKKTSSRNTQSLNNDTTLTYTYWLVGNLSLKTGQMDEALHFYNQAIEASEHSNKTKSRTLLNAYTQLGKIHYKQGNDFLAANTFQKAYELHIVQDDTLSKEFIKSCYYLGKTLIPLKTDSAFVYLNKCKQQTDLFDLSFKTDLERAWANYYFEKAQYNESLDLANNTIKVQETILPINDIALARSYNTLGRVYEMIDNIDTALIFYKTASKLLLPYKDNYPRDYVNLLEYRARANFTIDNYNMADSLCTLMLVLSEKHFKSNCYLHFKHLAYKARFLQESEQFEQAESHCRSTIDSLITHWGKDNLVYEDLVFTLGLTYLYSGQYKEAEPLLIENVENAKARFGAQHTHHTQACNQLGILYIYLNNYAEAERLFEFVVQMDALNYGKDHFEYIVSVQNMAAVYRMQGKSEEAIEMYQEALQGIENTMGKNSIRYATISANVAMAYLSLNNFSEGEKYYLQTKSILESMDKMQNKLYAITCLKLGFIHFNLKNYSHSEQYYLEAKTVIDSVFSITHRYYFDLYIDMAQLYSKMGDYNKSLAFHLKGIEAIDQRIIDGMSHLSEKEKELFYGFMENSHALFNSFIYDNIESNPELAGYAFNNILKTKGLILNSSTEIRKKIISTNDSLLSQYQQWLALRQELAEQYTRPVKFQDKNIRTLEKEANDLEKELIKQSGYSEKFKQEYQTNWRAIKNALKNNEVAIEFSHFKYHSNPDSIVYCAIIITAKEEFPLMIKLFEEKELEHIIGEQGKKNYAFISELYGNKQAPKALYNLLWKKIEPKLKQANTLYISPSGLLHKIPFAAIHMANKQPLITKYNINTLLTSAQILTNYKVDISASAKATIIGGIDYSGGEDSYGWTTLEGTAREAHLIDSILQLKTMDRSLLTEKEASKTALKHLAPESNILHIATHGFFFSANDKDIKLEENKPSEEEAVEVLAQNIYRSAGKNRFAQQKNPMLRAGLLFAGANKSWYNDSVLFKDNGILTAYEISNMDLHNTNLVVLSACKTGLGDIKNHEGIYGLQRAFKMAGSNYILMTLWRIFDKETEEFMASFYSNLVELNNIDEAFTKTQRSMQKKYDPYYWAGFVLVR